MDNEKDNIIFVENKDKLVSSYVVLDIETTGLSPSKNEIS